TVRLIRTVASRSSEPTGSRRTAPFWRTVFSLRHLDRHAVDVFWLRPRRAPDLRDDEQGNYHQRQRPGRPASRNHRTIWTLRAFSGRTVPPFALRSPDEGALPVSGRLRSTACRRALRA